MQIHQTPFEQVFFHPPNISRGSAFSVASKHVLTRYLEDIGCLGTMFFRWWNVLQHSCNIYFKPKAERVKGAKLGVFSFFVEGYFCCFLPWYITLISPLNHHLGEYVCSSHLTSKWICLKKGQANLHPIKDDTGTIYIQGFSFTQKCNRFKLVNVFGDADLLYIIGRVCVCGP